MVKNKGLGKGLNALMQLNIHDEDQETHKDEVVAGFLEMDISLIKANPSQPRKLFDQTAIESLAQSIKTYGLIQPITVSKKGDFFEIIAGERRFRASQIAGINKVPVIIKDISHREKLEISLVENIQRENLNTIEEALAYQSLIETYNLTQDQLSDRIGKSRSAITNTLRLLSLEIKIQKYIIDGAVTPGHARAILSLEDKSEQINFCDYIIKNELSVRESEKAAKNWKAEKRNLKQQSVVKFPIELKNAQQKIEEKFQTKVTITGNENKGKIQIEYFTIEDLERILEILD